MELNALATAWFNNDSKWSQDYVNILKSLKEPVPQVVFIALENGEKIREISQNAVGKQSIFETAIGNLMLYEDTLYVSTLGKSLNIDVSTAISLINGMREDVWPQDKNMLANQYLPYIIPLIPDSDDIAVKSFNADATWENDFISRAIDIYIRYNQLTELIKINVPAILMGTFAIFERYRLAVYRKNEVDVQFINALMNADANWWSNNGVLMNCNDMKSISLMLKR